MIKLIIFDFDGVIADTFKITYNINKKLLENLSKKNVVSTDEFRGLRIADWRDLYKKTGMTNEEIMNMPKLFIRELSKHSDETKFFDGVADAIRHLREIKRFKLAIASNRDKATMEYILSKNGILDCFDFIAGIETGIKPDPRQLNVCMQNLGAKSEETVIVGDMRGDIECGRNAKIAKVIAVSYGYQNEDALNDADVIAKSPKELFEMLEALE